MRALAPFAPGAVTDQHKETQPVLLGSQLTSSRTSIVVGYNPDIEVLDELLTSLAAQVEFLVLVDNGGSETFLAQAPEVRAHGSTMSRSTVTRTGCGAQYRLRNGD